MIDGGHLETAVQGRGGRAIAVRILIGICLACAIALSASAPAEAQGLLGPLPSSLGTPMHALNCGVAGEDPSDEVPQPPLDTPSAPFVGLNEDAVAGVHGVSAADYVKHVRTIGGNVIRTNIDWRNAEPKHDCWDEKWWGHWRELYESALARGVRPVFIIGASPEWARNQSASERDCKNYAGCVFPPSREMDPEWSEYAAEVASRFPRALIEVWNEPNLTSMWSSGPNPERFAELLVLADGAIESVSPETEVVLGGLLNVRGSTDLAKSMRMREFLARAYAASPSIKGHFDYLGIHPYTTKARIGRKSAFKRGFRHMRSIRDANRDPKPILVTEFGISTASPVVDEARQTRSLGRVHDQLAAWPDVAGVIYHRAIEPRDTTDDPTEHGYAWLRFGKSPPEPRPVYCHFAARAGNAYVGC
jgi:hypothetical protein